MTNHRVSPPRNTRKNEEISERALFSVQPSVVRATAGFHLLKGRTSGLAAGRLIRSNHNPWRLPTAPSSSYDVLRSTSTVRAGTESWSSHPMVVLC
jgi:hypothetical protein